MEGLGVLLKSSIGEGKLSGIKVSRLLKILHLLFVDDVLIMSKSCLIEWKEIINIINLLCKSYGLEVNHTKITVHFEGLTKCELSPFKTILPYTFSDLSSGFNYLGYYLDKGVHKVGDWDCLVAKITKKISLWCNIWLSIGGRYILIKTVLEVQHVYWMSMEVIPRSVLNKIRKLMFHFLWSG